MNQFKSTAFSIFKRILVNNSNILIVIWSCSELYRIVIESSFLLRLEDFFNFLWISSHSDNKYERFPSFHQSRRFFNYLTWSAFLERADGFCNMSGRKIHTKSRATGSHVVLWLYSSKRQIISFKRLLPTSQS